LFADNFATKPTVLSLQRSSTGWRVVIPAAAVERLAHLFTSHELVGKCSSERIGRPGSHPPALRITGRPEEARAINYALGLNTHRNLSLCYLSSNRYGAILTKRTVPSLHPAARVFPSGEKASALT